MAALPIQTERNQQRFLISERIEQAMGFLTCDPRTVFVGQSCLYKGASIHSILSLVPTDRRIEMPVIEDFQMGFCTGLALAGKIPICIYPRMDFLLLALNQLVNHLDRIPMMSGFRPKVIVRTQVRSGEPLNPGVQHLGDYTWAIASMLRTVKTVSLKDESEVMDTYKQALADRDSWLIVEYVP